MNLAKSTPEQRRAGSAGARNSQDRAALREDVPDGYGDRLLDGPSRRRLRQLELDRDRPWTPLAVRWIDSQPDPGPIRARYLAAHPSDRRPMTWAMPQDDTPDRKPKRPPTPEEVARRAYHAAVSRAAWERKKARYEERHGTVETRAAERERLRAAQRTPEQQKRHDYYLARKARKEQEK